MPNVRIERLNHTYQEEISMILMKEIKDENIKFVTITDCEITNDLSYAKVYITIFDKDKKESTLKALEKAKGFIRTELAKRVQIRHTPELRFVIDESIEYGNKIDNIIEKIHEKDSLN